MTMRTCRDQRGFTLVELMIVVALIAVLAAIVIPTFAGEVRHVKADSEVLSVFSEIRIKEEQNKMENSVYAALQAHPAAPSVSLQPFAATLPADWLALRIMPPQNQVRCSYEVFAGAGGTNTPAPVQAAPFNVPATPTISWWVAVATCDTDGDPGLNGVYVTSSMNPETLSENSGR
jgi:prepilin-type N-terminal cleavage/methylation domain-containing protein